MSTRARHAPWFRRTLTERDLHVAAFIQFGFEIREEPLAAVLDAARWEMLVSEVRDVVPTCINGRIDDAFVERVNRAYEEISAAWCSAKERQPINERLAVWRSARRSGTRRSRQGGESADYTELVSVTRRSRSHGRRKHRS